MGTLALIGLGSNLGDRRAILDAAVAAMAETPGVEVRAISSYHETSPVGGPAGQGPFLNAAARLVVGMDPLGLLGHLSRIEYGAGRLRRVRWGERTLDLDLLMYASKVLNSPELTLPHPRMAIRRFVLAPLSEIAPEIVDTTIGRTVADLLSDLDRRPSLVAIYGPHGPLKAEVMDRVVQGLSAVAVRGGEFDLPGDESGDRLHQIILAAENAARLDAGGWRAARLGDRWLASDFCPEFDCRRVGRIEGTSVLQGPFESERKRAATFEAYGRLITNCSEALRPTFAAILPGWAEPLPHQVHSATFPLLRPQADDASGIADEILAACASTRPGPGFA